MPQIADIVAKNGAAANVTFKALVPASGDTPALWRAQSVSPVPANQPSLSASHRRNAGRDSQKLNGVISVPYFTTDASGNTRVVANIPFNFTVTRPDQVPDAFANDFTAYVQSIVASALFGDMIRNGFSAT